MKYYLTNLEPFTGLPDTFAIQREDDGKFFRGYDFMGSIDWSDGIYLADAMRRTEAEQIIHDLESMEG